LIHAAIRMPEGVTYFDALGGHSAISPDGSAIAFVGSDSTTQQSLWVRPLSSTVARHLAGTHNATYPFWSPEGKSIAFFADGKLKTIDADGGPSIAIADAPFGRGGAWSPNGEIVFSPSVSDPNLYAVPASGGERRLVLSFDSTKAPRFPSFLSDGERFVFSLLEGQQLTVPSLHVGSLKENRSTLLASDASHGVVTAGGYLLYLRQGILMAQRFDETSQTLLGRPSSLQEGVNAWAPRAKGDFSASENGILLYAGGQTADNDAIVWISGQGEETGITLNYFFTRPTLSPDGTRVAYDEVQQQQETHVWVYDMQKKTKTRITFDPYRTGSPCWSPDGAVLFFNMEVAGNKAVIGMKRVDGSGTIEIISQGDHALNAGYYPVAVTPDGGRLLIQVEDESKSELGVIDLRDIRQPRGVTLLGIKGPGRTRDRNAFSLSPDGRWIAYESRDTGVNAIFVTALGGTSGRWQVTPASGMNPLWAKGRIVYYAMNSNRNEAVTFTVEGGTPVFGSPEPLLPPGRGTNNMLYGITPDGKKYLGVRRSHSGSGSQLSIIVNWRNVVSDQ
jgi:serine/threonine-protein kinase